MLTSRWYLRSLRDLSVCEAANIRSFYGSTVDILSKSSLTYFLLDVTSEGGFYQIRGRIKNVQFLLMAYITYIFTYLG